MWYCKMYFPGRHEVIESDAFGTQGAPSQRKAFPFLESLLSFTELDTGKVAVALRCISDDLESLDRERVTNAMVRLGALADTHSFFRVLYAKWFYFRSVGFGNTEAVVSDALDELRTLPEELPLYQKQIQRFFELILDIDKAGREPSRQVMRYYHFDQPDQPSDPELFPFRLLTTRFEPVDGDACAPVLYANTVADMISFSLQTCVERSITVRRCKNCGRYFVVTGNITQDYCTRLMEGSEKTCRQMGAVVQYQSRQMKNPAAREFTRSYKAHNARVRYGTMSKAEFTAWSKTAREKRDACVAGKLSLEDFVAWLDSDKQR